MAAQSVVPGWRQQQHLGACRNADFQASCTPDLLSQKLCGWSPEICFSQVFQGIPMPRQPSAFSYDGFHFLKERVLSDLGQDEEFRVSEEERSYLNLVCKA